MPYYQNRRYGRRSFRRRSRWGTSGSYKWKGGGMNRQKKSLGKLYRDVALLKRSQEYKFLDSVQTVLPIVDTGINNVVPTYLLPDLSIGDTRSTRDGLKVLSKSLQLKILISNNRGTPTDNIVRVIVFKQTKVISDTGSPVNTDLLQDSDSVISPYKATAKNMNWQKLLDQTLIFDTELHTQKLITSNFKFNDTIHFDGNTGDETGTNGTRLYIFAISQTLAAATANAPGITWSLRYRYLDG